MKHKINFAKNSTRYWNTMYQADWSRRNLLHNYSHRRLSLVFTVNSISEIAFCLSSLPPTWALPEIKQPMRDLRGEVDWNARGNLVTKRNDPRKLKFISLTIVRYTCDACLMKFVIELAHCGVSVAQSIGARNPKVWGSVVEHRSAEYESLRLDSSWGLRFFSFFYARARRKITFARLQQLWQLDFAPTEKTYFSLK